MKKILLLGDSIRMGYDSYIKEELSEFEVVYDDSDNGRFSAYTIWQFNYLNNRFGPFDIVHFNNGYWDMNTEGPKGERITPIEDYIHNFKRLISMIKESGATPIFATTTPIFKLPIPTGEIAPNKLYTNEDVKEYNEAALKLMKEEGVVVDDLYSLMLQEPGYGKCSDNLHLTEECYKKCAKQASEVIRQVAKSK
ncbi:MAG: GDSL-type esterase/lipase family protein [Bacilli bacterium]|nr:GDSL-type esterase/lipase family protein [Bacilli bacterium]